VQEAVSHLYRSNSGEGWKVVSYLYRVRGRQQALGHIYMGSRVKSAIVTGTVRCSQPS
jgi:hypothetical protein